MKQVDQLNLPHSPEQINLFEQIKENTPYNAIIVEIGSYVGTIANCFVGGGRKVFSIDPWQSEGVFDKDDIQYELIKDAENRGGVDVIYKTWLKNAGDDLFLNMFPIKGFSYDIAPFWTLPIDLLYIDGDHNYEACKKDILDWFPKVRPGGIIMGDDYNCFEGVTKAVDELLPYRQIHCGNQWFSFKKLV